MSLSENSPSPYLQVLSCASQQQRHMVDARQLLALYFTGDLDTVARFKERHASIETGYVPTLLDAHVLVAGTGMQMQRLSLEKLKKDAKRLLKRLRAEDSAAWLMMRQFHPASDGLDVASVKLADVQLVLARSNALAIWPKLKAHIEAMQVAGVRMAALQAGDAVAPDADLKTLHIRCGSDLCEQIKVCGFAGQFVESNNPFIQGEVPAFDGRDESLQHFSRVRGAFLQRAFMPFAGEDMVESIEGSGEGTLEHMRFMQQLPGDTRRIVLWFEHEPYDQL
ncbi:MAG: hypothetical protein HRU20_26695, partial [Pseudomonadales bacterium]|nr:hypothetical protein [Pseudomonadales bacterium]